MHQFQNKTAVLLVNLGTPDKPDRKNVARFLSEFLGDGRVIDLPYFFRKILVNLIIVPFRSGKSSKMYRQLWTQKGSPILYNTQKLSAKLQKKLSVNYEVFMAMRYGNPSMNSILSEIEKQQFKKLIIIPLFPQYASSTVGSIIEKSLNIIAKWNYIPELRVISEFYKNPLFIKAWITKLQQLDYNKYEHILFSYHGLPEKHVERTHNNISCTEFNCSNELNKLNYACYRAQCYYNTRLIINELNLSKEMYSVGFQSRFGKRWLNPFTEDIIKEKAKNGIKKILVIPMSFVADCLETKVEIDIEYKKLFMAHGGKELKMPDSLNDDDLWVESLKSLICNFEN